MASSILDGARFRSGRSAGLGRRYLWVNMELAASSLDMEIMAWFTTREWAEFQLIRQEILLAFMEVVEGAGTSFAFPTRTVHVVQEPAV